MKSIIAVVVGVIATIVVTSLVDILLHVVGVYPPWGERTGDGLSALATSYRIVITIGAAWLTARLAPANPMKHAIALGCVGVVLGLIGVAVSWNQDLAPRWYPVALTVLAIPQCWAGGLLYEQTGRR